MCRKRKHKLKNGIKFKYLTFLIFIFSESESSSSSSSDDEIEQDFHFPPFHNQNGNHFEFNHMDVGMEDNTADTDEEGEVTDSNSEESDSHDTSEGREDLNIIHFKNFLKISKVYYKSLLLLYVLSYKNIFIFTLDFLEIYYSLLLFISNC